MKVGSKAKLYEPAVCIAPNSFPLSFFISQSLLFIHSFIYFFHEVT